MILRKAKHDDWKTLLDWRNDPITRKYSHTQDIVSEGTHKAWFVDTLMSTYREIYILEDNLVPVGTIRSDNIGLNKYLLSWNISSNHRGKGYGTELLRLYLQDRKGEFVAEIKPENIASIKMVEKNGFTKLTDVKYVKKQ